MFSPQYETLCLEMASEAILKITGLLLHENLGFSNRVCSHASASQVLVFDIFGLSAGSGVSKLCKHNGRCGQALPDQLKLALKQWLGSLKHHTRLVFSSA